MTDIILVASTPIVQIPSNTKDVLVDIDQTLRGPICFQVKLRLPVTPMEGHSITICDICGLYEKVSVHVGDESKHTILVKPYNNTCKFIEITLKNTITLVCTGKLYGNGYDITWIEI